MNKAFKTIGFILIAVIVIIGIYFSVPPKTLDFRGTITKIETTDKETTFYIEQSTGISYTVVADNKTKVKPCHKNDPDVTLDDIEVGDTIEGDYRWNTKSNKAKFITVWCEN